MNPKTKETTNRQVKSSAFTALFGNPKNAAALYRALEQEDIMPEDIDYATLSDVLFMTRKNDLAFTVKRKVLVISEHQSTVNDNMPLRNMIYYGRTAEKLIENPNSLYRSKQIFIPTPEFYVFYNGIDPFPKEKILQLSDAYLVKTEAPMLELKTKVININLQENHPLLQECRPMYEYSWLIQTIRKGTGDGMSRDEAIITAIEEAKKQGILLDFLQEHGTEASNMLFTQFNMDDALRVRGEEKYEDGKADGMALGMASGKAEGIALGMADAVLELLEVLGSVPDAGKEKIMTEKDIGTLTLWLKLAAKADSIEEFLEKIVTVQRGGHLLDRKAGQEASDVHPM